MVTIKRYANRKLYDTEAKQYITLDGIAELIRHGAEIQVVDHATGEDLTTLILTQIILEQEKKPGGFLPRGVLTGLIQAGGETLSNLRRVLLTPAELARHVDQEVERRIQALVNQGLLPRNEGRALIEKLRLQSTPHHDEIPEPEELEQALTERGVPTREDFQQLMAQLEVLSAEVETLRQPPGAPPSSGGTPKAKRSRAGA
jgi:polyhydroxyalkanoate synthesis repressor PhaR